MIDKSTLWVSPRESNFSTNGFVIKDEKSVKDLENIGIDTNEVIGDKLNG